MTLRLVAQSEPPFVPEGFDDALLETRSGRFGIAVSGGGDSAALAVLVSERFHDRDPVILSVDHNVREGSAEDVEAVRALAARLDRPFAHMTVATPPCHPTQAWARRERYQLLYKMARMHGLDAVVTGHTMDDLAETFLMRQARRSGLRGLAALRPVAAHHGLTVLRPLLSVRRSALRRVLASRAIGWREDPSNDDARFARTRVRRLLPALADAGITVEALAASATHLARASDFVEAEVTQLWCRLARVDRSLVVRLDREAWAAAHEEVRLRVLARALHTAGGQAHEPRWRVVVNMDAELRAGRGTHGGGTLAVPDRGAVVIFRERRGLRGALVPPGGEAVFDNRFTVRSRATQAVAIAPLGPYWGRRLTGGRYHDAAPTVHRADAHEPGGTGRDTFLAAPTLGIRARGWPNDAVEVHALR